MDHYSKMFFPVNLMVRIKLYQKKYTNVANPYTFPIIWCKLKKEEGASFKFVFVLVILLNGVYCKFLC